MAHRHQGQGVHRPRTNCVQQLPFVIAGVLSCVGVPDDHGVKFQPLGQVRWHHQGPVHQALVFGPHQGRLDPSGFKRRRNCFTVRQTLADDRNLFSRRLGLSQGRLDRLYPAGRVSGDDDLGFGSLAIEGFDLFPVEQDLGGEISNLGR